MYKMVELCTYACLIAGWILCPATIILFNKTNVKWKTDNVLTIILFIKTNVKWKTNEFKFFFFFFFLLGFVKLMCETVIT